MGADIPLLIGSNLNEWSGYFEAEPIEETEELTDACQKRCPSADGIPEWEPYTRESGATMLLDTESQLVYHHDQELMSILAPDYVY